MNYRTILFDFDGTIADTATLSLSVINSLGSEFGFVEATQEELPALRHMSARRLLKERLGISIWNIFKILRFERRFREEIAKRADEMHTVAGMREVLVTLRERGYELGIVTSKSPELVAKLMEEDDIPVDFIDAGSSFFGKVKAIKRAMRKYELDPHDTLYVGDELRDVDACKKVGIDMLAVGWGFNSPEALRTAGVRAATTPEELLGMLVEQGYVRSRISQ